MRVQMRYGHGTVAVEIPDENLAGVLETAASVPLADADKAVWQAISQPTASPPLAEVAKGRGSACIVISDITRPVPNQVILPPILETLEQAGISRDEITILIATGIHRPNEGNELEEMVGHSIMDSYRIVNHFSQKPEMHTHLGETRKGTPVYIDKTYLAADLKIITGLIEPHLMAGYSGGRKAICPGLASIETMKVMHGPELMEHPKSAVGILDGNPFHIEATEIALMAGVDFSLNVAIDKQRQITGVFAGDLVESHLTGAKFVEKNAKVTLSEPVDAVVVSSAGYPLDTTFYQAIKGLLTAVEIVKQGGSILLVAACSEGIGSKPFTDLLFKTDDLTAFVQGLYNPTNFVIDQWQLEELAKVARKADIYFYTDGIPYQQRSKLFVHPLKNPQEGIEELLIRYGEDVQIAAIPEGPYVLAKVESAVS
ncbi:MAG: nickel-dependent lactate racemase [Candidatus Poribacteria bacterium]|nr:nickel-dependent lactate racemase [Candidatus Poribacteria bacterium]